MTLDELIAKLTTLRQTDADGATPIYLEPDAWARDDHMEIDDVEREPDRFMIRWGS